MRTPGRTLSPGTHVYGILDISTILYDTILPRVYPQVEQTGGAKGKIDA